MAKRTASRGVRAWQVKSVWVKTREGPERVLSGYRLLLELPPPSAPRELSPPWRPPSSHRTAGCHRQSLVDTSLLD
jgi:hypothetical protein